MNCKHGFIRDENFKCTKIKKKTSKVKKSKVEKHIHCASINKDYNPKTKRCLNKCKSNEIRNSKNKCVKNLSKKLPVAANLPPPQSTGKYRSARRYNSYRK